MHRRILISFAAIALLSACGGGGGSDSGPQTGGGDVSAPTLGEVQAANPMATHSAADRVAGNLPRFGSVTQSSNTGTVAGITGDSASTSFDGSNVQVTIRREDGSSLVLNSATDAFDRQNFNSGIDGHTGRAYSLLQSTDTTVSVSVTAVSWGNTDQTDYLAGGYWMSLEGTTDPLRITGVEVGAFVDGPELSSPPTLPTIGTASYQGPAAGIYATRFGSDSQVPVGSVEIGEFAAVADLTADFVSMTISGCVGCTGTIGTAGIFQNAATGETFDTYDSSNLSVVLGAAPIAANGSFRNQGASVTSPDFTVASSNGSWGGQFSNIPDAQGDPRLVAGTFGGEAASTGGTEVVFVGAYVAPSR